MGQWDETLMKTRYMHTIDGRPAFYEEGQQVCFIRNGYALELRFSLAQIIREQRASSKWRRQQGLSNFDAKYGYLLVKA